MFYMCTMSIQQSLHCSLTRAVESEAKQFWRAGAKNFSMVESEPEIRVQVPQP